MAREDRIKQRLGRLHQGRHRLDDERSAQDVQDPQAPQEAPSPPPVASHTPDAPSFSPPSHPFAHLPHTSLITHQGHQLVSFDHHYEASHLHGDQPLSRALDPHWPRLGLEPLEPSAVLYLDIETSGFGADDTIFCVGLGQWLEQPQRFHVKQLVITQPQAEGALLSLVWAMMSAPSVMRWVSFNGASFDVPRLRARALALAPDAAHDAQVEHLDLMKLVRSKSNRQRRYGLRIQEVTRLELVRRDDVPGKEAPERWRRFIRTQEPELLAGLIKHNALDVLSLAALVGVLGARSEEQQQLQRQQVATEAPVRADEADASPTLTSATAAPSRELARQQTARRLGEQLGQDVHKKLERSYALRARSGPSSSRDARTSDVYGLREAPQPTPQADPVHLHHEHDPKVGQRVAALRARVEAQLKLGATPLECMGLLAELVALQPAHPHGLELLAEAYEALGLLQCAQSLRARQRASSPY